uniref:Uncharacterized protein n=1 Tax=Anguilla anguilla TaxID=7936 RepID=A0A0E9V3A5_ANGAN
MFLVCDGQYVKNIFHTIFQLYCGRVLICSALAAMLLKENVSEAARHIYGTKNYLLPEKYAPEHSQRNTRK